MKQLTPLEEDNMINREFIYHYLTKRKPAVTIVVSRPKNSRRKRKFTSHGAVERRVQLNSSNFSVCESRLVTLTCGLSN
jgi:hypothetical protein